MARLAAYDPDDVRAAVRALLQRGEPAKLERVAAELATSRSAIHRVMSVAGLRFDTELRRIRAEIALRVLVKGGSVRRAALAAGVCPDHLRQIFKREWGLLPSEVGRAMLLVARMRAWREAIPPEFGTRRYFRQRVEWRETEAELHAILGEASRDGPLRRLASDVLKFARRPDYRRAKARRHVRESRAARRQADREMLEELLNGLQLNPTKPRRASNRTDAEEAAPTLGREA